MHPKIGKFTCFIFTLIAKNRLFFPLCFIVWDFRKKLQYKFPNLRGRGSKVAWNFPKNSSVLVPWPVQGERCNHWKTKQFLKLVIICNSPKRYRWHNVLQRMTSITHVSLSASAPHAWFCWHIDHCPSTMSVHLLPKNVSFSCPWEQRLSMKSGQRVWKDLLSHGLKE